MITLLYGENSYELHQAQRTLAAEYSGEIERIDGTQLDNSQIPDLLSGTTLFSADRMVFIKNLSENKRIWPDFGEWAEKISDTTHIVLVDAKPDKRTKTFKTLQKYATVQEYKSWGDRDVSIAEKWAVGQSKLRGFELQPSEARLLVGRTGLDQWVIASALDKLSVMDVISAATINDIVEANPAENVFNLFEAALRGDSEVVTNMIRTLSQTDDPFMVFGLLSGQAFQLLAVATSNKPGAQVAKDIGAHPFALQKLSPHAKRLGVRRSSEIVASFARADTAMKSTGHEPWMLVEQALMKTAVISNK